MPRPLQNAYVVAISIAPHYKWKNWGSINWSRKMMKPRFKPRQIPTATSLLLDYILPEVSLEYLSVKDTIRKFNWIQSCILPNANIFSLLSFTFCLNNTEKIFFFGGKISLLGVSALFCTENYFPPDSEWLCLLHLSSSDIKRQKSYHFMVFTSPFQKLPSLTLTIPWKA